MLNILGMIILIIILLIIIFLIIGIKISLIYDKKGSDLKGCLKILIFKKIKIYSYDFTSKDDDSADEIDSEDDDETDELNLKKLFELAKPCFEDFKTFIKSVLDTIKIKKVENHLIFGMDSYADTGKYIGMIWGVLAIINSMNEKLHLSAEPSFNGSILDGHGVNEIEISIIKLIHPTIKLISNKDVRTFIRGVFDAR